MICSALTLAFVAQAWADPQLTSWFTVNSGQVARIYRTDQEKLSGQPETTWSNGRQSQSEPAFSGVQEIYSSANWVYVRSTGLGSHIMGPWYDGPSHQRLFPNLPTDQHLLFAIPRHPKAQTARGFNHLGEVGMFVDGVRMFDSGDAFSYSHAAGRDADPRARIGQGDHIWNRDAYVNEGLTFDAALGHQQNWGRYHYHAQPLALRYLLGDHVNFDAARDLYGESSGPATRHSPILGWTHDGYPVYGPYGYSDPSNPAGGVRRMVSGFVMRNGSSGADNLTQTGRRTLPAWAARELEQSAALESVEFGPNVSSSYPLGHYLEDYAYLGDLGKTQGKDFDLDEFNGRHCVTPEFPQGTYAYFTTIDANGKPVYPYIMGRRFYGNPVGQLITSLGEAVTTNFVAHPSQAANGKAALPSAKARTLTWSPGSAGYDAK